MALEFPTDDQKRKPQLEKSYIKLIKNTKGHNWEIKAFEDTTKETMDEIRERVLDQENKLFQEVGE